MARNRIITYDARLRNFARELRKNGTRAEVRLWRELQGRKLGVQFHRQVPIDSYIVDFYCHELGLAIEVDGSSHEHPEAYVEDTRRQQRLESLGVTVVRFRDEEVFKNTEGVVGMIRDHIAETGNQVKEQR